MPNQYDPDSPWRDEAKVALLRKMIAKGAFRSDIARALGVTRSAVIGKAKRLGLSLPGSAGEEARAAAARRWSARSRAKRCRKANASVMLVTDSDPQVKAEIGNPRLGQRRHAADNATTPETRRAPLMLTLLELTPHSCRWPFGDPDRPGFGFCGHARAKGSSYCEAHRDISVGAAEAPDKQAAAA
jgi:GcrA cell cycle regulator